MRPVSDNYYGTKIADAYRYMEHLKTDEVQACKKAQNDITRAALASIPGRKALLKRIIELNKSTPLNIDNVRRSPRNRYLHTKRLAHEDVDKLYRWTELDGQEKLVADPDRIATAERNRSKDRNVIAKKYTSAARLSGMGESAGGILFGRAVTERPD